MSFKDRVVKAISYILATTIFVLVIFLVVSVVALPMYLLIWFGLDMIYVAFNKEVTMLFCYVLAAVILVFNNWVK